jgi:hypothetical protein
MTFPKLVICALEIFYPPLINEVAWFDTHKDFPRFTVDSNSHFLIPLSLKQVDHSSYASMICRMRIIQIKKGKDFAL